MAGGISLLSVLGCHFMTEIFQICQIIQILRVIQSYQIFCTVNLCYLAKRGKMRVSVSALTPCSSSNKALPLQTHLSKIMQIWKD